MKKLITKWKTLNKIGLKLSLICGFNWLILFVAKSQFYLFSAAFLGILTYYLPQDYRIITVNLVELFVTIKVILYCIRWFSSSDIKQLKSALSIFVLMIFFIVETEYASQHLVTDYLVLNLFKFWVISVIFTSLVIFLQPRLFKYYVFKHIINKKYLGIRKLTDDLPPAINFYTDADEIEVDKRMQLINQNVIKQPYQDVVELTFLNREVITGVGYKATHLDKEKERTFIEDDTIYYPIFNVFPFGKEVDFYHRLLRLVLSKKAAFTKQGKASIKSF